jgi:tetratricopeptide (TPR) repeat protein
MSALPDLAQQALEHARRGDFHQALVLAKRALSTRSSDFGLMLFVGMLHSRRLELDKAATHFREAMRLAPRDPIPRLELARVLIGLNQLDDAEELLLSARLTGLEPKRLSALIAIRRGQPLAAVAIYREIVADDLRDFESWGNLGVSLLAAGDPKAAIEALTNSLGMRRDQQRFREKWAEAQIAAGEGEEGLKLCLAFAAEHPDDVLVRVTIARLHDLLGRPEQALESLGEALRLDPAHAPALVALAQLHERQNRLDESAAAIAQLERLDSDLVQLPLLRARLAYRRGDFATALELARASPEVSDPGSRAQLIGQICDRMGDAASAFEAFVEMNRDLGIAPEVAEARGTAYRQLLARRMRLATRRWVRGWTRSTYRSDAREPVFIVGFPRSGTTLLDTLLMGHPDVCVSEEKPMLDAVARSIGGYERIAELDEGDLETLRNLYFAQAAEHVPDLGGRLLVDKQPFAMVEAPLIHRLFPSARFLFVQRHPCDVVLSCFITRFEPAGALVNFTTLKGAATLFDEMMRFWGQCRTILPMIVHRVRYERLVEDAEPEMRALMAFLGLEWDAAILDNRGTAKDRGFINTPSYAQVAEPLYDRSIGRWERYREQMQPVLPILAPWAQRFGYEI